MGILSSSTSITRYRVNGQIAEPFMENVITGLKNHMIHEIDNDPAEKSAGFTCFETPFKPDFDNANLVFGTHLIFSLRVDKKTIPSSIIKKQVNAAIAKRLADSDRQALSNNEKREIRDDVTRRLYTRIPAAPSVYDLIWNYEGGELWFLTNLKAANEELENLFSKAFKLSLIRLFPYTAAEIACGLSDAEKDRLSKLSPTQFFRGQHA